MASANINIENKTAINNSAHTKNMRKLKENLVGYSFISFSLIGFLTFMVFPLFYSLFLSFMDWNMFKGLEGSEFIGFKNYTDVFKDEYFITGFWNNLKLAVMVVPLLIFLALVVAVLLNGKIFARGALRAAYFMPYVAISTASALVFSAIFHPEFGPVNSFLISLGMQDPPGWATSIAWALPTVAVFLIWKNIGYCIVIFLAALQGVSPSYYEAASIDGASKVQQFLKITVPLVSPTTFFLVITNMIMAFRTFEEVQILTNGGPGTTTYTMVFSIYKEAFEQFDMGFSSAASWVYFLVVLAVTVVQFLGQKKWVNY